MSVRVNKTNHIAAVGLSHRKLRIAIFGSRGIPHTYGGAEAFMEELAPRLAERGHDVLIYCRRSLFKDRPRMYRGVRLVYLPSIETKVLGTTHRWRAQTGKDSVYIMKSGVHFGSLCSRHT